VQSDYVDAAVDGWAKQWPSLQTSALEVMTRLDRVARHLDRRTAEVLADSGLSGRDLDVLGALRRAGAPFGLPATQLARAAMLTSGGMTGQADRLANAGLVVRRPDPEDRRAVVVTLTPEGRGVAERALKTYLQASEDVLSVLDEDERATLVELLRKLLVELEGEAASDATAASADESSTARGTTAQARSKTGSRSGGRKRFEEGA
jgi:DNA-binding MarR family transcriptional regulator